MSLFSSSASVQLQVCLSNSCPRCPTVSSSNTQLSTGRAALNFSTQLLQSLSGDQWSKISCQRNHTKPSNIFTWRQSGLNWRMIAVFVVCPRPTAANVCREFAESGQRRAYAGQVVVRMILCLRIPLPMLHSLQIAACKEYNNKLNDESTSSLLYQWQNIILHQTGISCNDVCYSANTMNNYSHKDYTNQTITL